MWKRLRCEASNVCGRLARSSAEEEQAPPVAVAVAEANVVDDGGADD